MSVFFGICSMIMLALFVMQLVVAVISIVGAVIVLPLMPIAMAVETWLKVTK